MKRRQLLVRGFTLLEVLVALMVGALAVAGTAGLLEGLSDTAATLNAKVRSLDLDANAERTMRELTANIDRGSDSTFVGDARVAAFQSWCPSPEGWLARCAVRLTVHDRRTGGLVVAAIVPGDTTTLAIHLPAGSAAFRYLVDPAHGGVWVDHWSTREPPPAMAVVAGADTLLLKLGTGG